MMRAFTLMFTDECGQDVEHDFEAPSDLPAVAYTLGFIRGNEGLWSGVHLVGESGEITPPEGTWY